MFHNLRRTQDYVRPQLPGKNVPVWEGAGVSFCFLRFLLPDHRALPAEGFAKFFMGDKCSK